MYNAFYELQREPFHVTPDPEFLFPSPAHKEALAAIIYGIEQRKGFVAITGEVGVGKTTILRSYLDFADRENLKLIYVYNSNLSFDELVTMLLQELGIEARPPSTFQAVTLLHEALIDVYRKNQTVVLIIDEAQNMPVETLESLRMLSNLETVTEKLIQIMLIGQPEFDELLQQHRLRQLRQRIAIHARIDALNMEDSLAYLEHRLAKVALGTKPVFTKNALKMIAEASAGIPRTLNILSDNALITGYGYQVRPVNTKIVKEVLTDRGFLPAAPEPKREQRSRAGVWAAAGLATAAVVALVVAVLAFQPDLLSRGERQLAQIEPTIANRAEPPSAAREETPPVQTSRSPETTAPPPAAASETAPPAPPRAAGNPPVEQPRLLDRPPVVAPSAPPAVAAQSPREQLSTAQTERPAARQAPAAQPAAPPVVAIPPAPPPRPAEIARTPPNPAPSAASPRPTETARAPSAPTPSAPPRPTEITRTPSTLAPSAPREAQSAPAPASRPAPASPSVTPSTPAPAAVASAPPNPAPPSAPAPLSELPAARSGSVETAAVPRSPSAASPTPLTSAPRRAQGPIPLGPPARPVDPNPGSRAAPSIAAAPAPSPAAAPTPAVPSVMMPSASGSGIAAAPSVEVADAAATGQPLPAPPPPSTQTVKAVRAGDSLWTMAEEVYGFVSPSILRRLQDANPQIRNINVLAPGQEVVFPRVQDSPFDRGTVLSDSLARQGRN